MTGLDELLAGREERAELQRAMLEHADFVCQIALNIPGLPKRMEGDERAVKNCANELLTRFRHTSLENQELTNGAGFAILMSFCANPMEAKHAAVAIEEESPLGRVFDIDVITSKGSLSRTALGLPERKCLLCGRTAKLCARERSHGAEELRAAIAALITPHSEHQGS